MVRYGSQNFDDAPTNMHVRRVEQKYNNHKLSVAIGHNKLQRKNGGESAKRKSSTR